MCLILLALQTHPGFKLILAANRDEFYERASQPPRFWKEAPRLLAGRDLVGGGTWLGITRCGKIAAVTNYRDPGSFKNGAPSRGSLVTDFLLGKKAPSEYLESLRPQAERYNGFNLLVGEKDRLFWASNRSERPVPLSPGIYGLSNRLLNTPWPKVVRGKERLAEILRDPANPSSAEIFDLLQDRHRPPDQDLPSTGVSLEWERVLSPIFIQSPDYGTRSSTLIFIDRKDHVLFLDRTYGAKTGCWEQSEFEFDLESG